MLTDVGEGVLEEEEELLITTMEERLGDESFDV